MIDDQFQQPSKTLRQSRHQEAQPRPRGRATVDAQSTKPCPKRLLVRERCWGRGEHRDQLTVHRCRLKRAPQNVGFSPKNRNCCIDFPNKLLFVFSFGFALIFRTKLSFVWKIHINFDRKIKAKRFYFCNFCLTITKNWMLECFVYSGYLSSWMYITHTLFTSLVGSPPASHRKTFLSKHFTPQKAKHSVLSCENRTLLYWFS